MRTPALAAAYAATTYRVRLPGAPVDVRVAVEAPLLAAWLAERGAGGWFIISAANPGSQRLSEAENLERHAALLNALHAAGFVALPAENIADDGIWPTELAWLVPVGDLQAAHAAALQLGRAFGQNAVLCGGADGIAALLWM